MIGYKYLPLILFYATMQFIIVLSINVILKLINIFIAPFGILFSQSMESKLDKHSIINYPGKIRFFGNDIDGIDGNDYWKEHYDKLIYWGLFPELRILKSDIPPVKVTDYLSRYWWMVVKNPLPNLVFNNYLTCPIDNCYIAYFGDRIVDKTVKYYSWQLVIATDKKKPFYWTGFYYLIRYPNSNKGFSLRLGYKIKPTDFYKENKFNKPFIFSINLNQDLS